MSTSILTFVMVNQQYIKPGLCDALTDGGHEVRFASNSEDAIATFNKAFSYFHALITDIDLAPDKLSRRDVGRHARKIKIDLPVI